MLLQGKMRKKTSSRILIGASFFLLTILAFLCLSITHDQKVYAAELPDTIGLFGDVNDDRSIDISDILLMNKFRLDKVEPTSEQFVLADVNQDGVIDMQDIDRVNDHRNNGETDPSALLITVCFDSGRTFGESDNYVCKPYNGNDKYGELPVPTERAGYAFDGWYTELQGGEKVTSETSVGTYHHVLYARYLKIYSIRFDCGMDTFPDTYAKYTNIEFVNQELDVCEGKKIGLLPEPKAKGYLFDHWTVSVDNKTGNQVVSSETIVNPKDNLWIYDSETNSITLHAVWTRDSDYHVLYWEGNTSVEGGKFLREGEAFGSLPDVDTVYQVVDGAVLSGWINATSFTVMGNTDVRLAPNASTSIFLDPNGGSVELNRLDYSIIYGMMTYLDNLPIPTRTGYDFIGWYTYDDKLVDASFGITCWKGKVTNSINSQYCGSTLTAKWEKKYTVSYDANGGTGTPASQEKMENVSLTLSDAKPTKRYVITYNASGGSVSPASKNVNCTFKNWNTAKNGSGKSYDAGGTYTDNADVTFYAQWTNPKAGELATPERSGYDFVGWYTSATGGEQITDSSTITGNRTLYAHWNDPYNLKDETYSFENFGDTDSPGGHCFGMSMTSAGYHNNLLDIKKIGGNSNVSLYSFEQTQIVNEPICFYQSIQGSYSLRSTVAGGSWYKEKRNDIDSDWQEVVNYVKNHDYDNTGLLQIGFRKNRGGHAINFLRYENVNGQDRIYAYDNNFPEVETYFYQDPIGRVFQAPVQTFSGAIDCIALRDVRLYFEIAKNYDSTHVIYMEKDAAFVQGFSYSYMEGDYSNEEYVMYEIPSDQDQVTIIPCRDNADFIYMGTEYSFGEITDDTYGVMKFTSMDEGAVTSDAVFRIYSTELGDVNGDGSVNAKDITVLAKHVAKIKEITDDHSLAAADVNKDGVVNAKDLTHLAKYVAKIISEL